MVQHHHVKGYDNFFEFMKKFQANEPVYVLYTGTKLPNGDSWCPDCVEGMYNCSIVIIFIFHT